MSQPGKSLSVGIVGARRLREGLGPFMARILHDEGIRIAGVCGRSLESAKVASAELKESLGIEAPAFPSLQALAQTTHPEGIAICTPFETHRDYLIEAGNAGLSAICEKPLIWNQGADPIADTEKILSLFESKKRGIVLNAQWPQMLLPFFSLFPELAGHAPKNFEMFLGPSGTGLSMILDSLSHPLSMLYRLVGTGEPQNIQLRYRESNEQAQMDISFDFRHDKGAVTSLVHLQTESKRPRTAWFAIDGHRVDREIAQPGYRFSLRAGTQTSATEDPMRLQIRDFLSALRGEKPFDPPQILRCHSQGLSAFAQAYERLAAK